MTSLSNAALALVLLVVSACTTPEVQTTTAVGPTVDGTPTVGPGHGGPVVVVPPPLHPQQLAALVESSPCDILPEPDTQDIVGVLAHPRGYPRFVGGDILFNESSPEDTPDPAVVRALTQGTTFESEVHDCQRLVVLTAGGLGFGPLVGILPLDSAMMLPDAAFDTGVAVATIYNWGDTADLSTPYPPLAIGDKWNCLWLRRDAAGSWSAAVTLDQPVACFERASPPYGDYTLDVMRLQHPDSIPRTARWGWDADSMVHQIGIKCGNAWCWVGPPSLFATELATLEGPAHSTIPGYFDEQHLALPGPQGGIVPGALARVTPTDTFFSAAMQQREVPADVEVMRAFFGSAPPIARIEMMDGTPAPPPYTGKWGGSETPVMMHVLLVPGTPPNQPPVFRSTFQRPGGPVQRTATPRVVGGAAHAAVGAVRWRWHDTDSTLSIWSACGVKGTDCCDTD